MKIQRILF